MTSTVDRDTRYVEHLRGLRESVGDERRAFELAVGGEFAAIGQIELELLRHAGLTPGSTVVDVGCGSGRLAIPLSRWSTGAYLGIDILRDLIEFARAECARPDWRFEVAAGFDIPAPSGSSDLVCFFSVFTHLLHEESYRYLRDAHRVLKPGGKVVFSFLDFSVAAHWPVFESTVLDSGAPHNQFLDRAAVFAWAASLGFDVEEIHAGDEFFIPLSSPVTWESGARFEDFAALGQSVAILSKPVAGASARTTSPATPTAVAAPAASVLDSYVMTAPSDQNAIDIFAGEWSSEFPDQFGVAAGHASLFEDARITWLTEKVGGGLRGRRVLELGPLEAGHTYGLVRAGAEVTAIEAQSRAYLKCLVAKEITGLTGARFLLGDFVEYLRGQHERFDVCVASGVLYHMRNPVELLELISRSADTVMLWTHYFDQSRFTTDPAFTRKFSTHTSHEHAGLTYRLHRFEYLEALESAAFCGGSAPHANWLDRADLFAVLTHLGWQIDAVDFDHPDHPNGPALALIASRSAS